MAAPLLQAGSLSEEIAALKKNSAATAAGNAAVAATSKDTIVSLDGLQQQLAAAQAAAKQAAAERAAAAKEKVCGGVRLYSCGWWQGHTRGLEAAVVSTN